MKTLLVPLTKSGNNAALSTAVTVARLFNAHIECCYVSPSVLQLAIRAMPLGEVGREAAEAIADRWEELKKDTTKSANKVHGWFTAFFNRNGLSTVALSSQAKTPSAAWVEFEGDYLETIVGRAWFNDLVLLLRSRYGDHQSVDLCGEVLLRTGRPILLVAKNAPKNLWESILIAWKPTPQAARAVTAAIPLLRNADNVTIATAMEDGVDHESAMKSASELAASLA